MPGVVIDADFGDPRQSMPARLVLIGLLVLAAAPPFLARGLGTYVGAFTMLTRVERYHLELSIRTASGEERVKLASLAPHLSRDARAVILPAEGYAAGADQIDVLQGGLEDIASLACELRPDASAARVRLYRGSFQEREMALKETEHPCGDAR